MMETALTRSFILNYSPIIWVITSQKIRQAWYVACNYKQNFSLKIWMKETTWQTDGKVILKWFLRKYKVKNELDASKYRDQWWASVNLEINLWVPSKAGNFSNSTVTITLSRTLLHGVLYSHYYFHWVLWYRNNSNIFTFILK